MGFPADPIEFVDEILVIHKKRLRSRRKAGESLKYMREAADQMGLGEEFMRLWVHNDKPARPDPHDGDTDLALLQIYEHWRAEHGMRPIEPWDGSRLRPWLPPEDNPRVPSILSTRLGMLKHAYTHFNPEYEAYWTRIDSLGNAVESYFHEVRRHHVWGVPEGGHLARLYYLNELNNIETAPYSLRFWGFLKWADTLRRQLFGLPIETYPHDAESDLQFLDHLNLQHFPWHDDVFEKGRCPRIDDQFGRQCRYRYKMGTQGYALEFLRFHADLVDAHDAWLVRNGRPAVKAWIPGKHHTSYILREAWGGLWGLGGTDGGFLDPQTYAPELLESQLTAFRTVADLGCYLELCATKYHGVGHISNCDIRDVYTNNYSVRFFGWHKWLETMHQVIRKSGRPEILPGTSLEDRPLPQTGKQTFCEIFKSPPTPGEIARRPLTGQWSFRTHDPKGSGDWFDGKLELDQDNDGLQGEAEIGGEEFVIEGHLDGRNVVYETEPEPYDRRVLIVFRATSTSDSTRVLTFTAHLPKPWPAKQHETTFMTGVVATGLEFSGKKFRTAPFHALKRAP